MSDVSNLNSNSHAGGGSSTPGGNLHRGGHGSVVPGFSRPIMDGRDRDLPDRGWSQSAPLPEQTMRTATTGGVGAGIGVGSGLGPRQSSMTGPVGSSSAGIMEGVVIEGGATEFAAPVPRHHLHQNQNHGNVRSAAGDGSSAGLMAETPGRAGTGGTAQWDRDPPRNTMAFATMKYPPGTFPSGGVYGEGVLFDHVRFGIQSEGSRLV